MVNLFALPPRHPAKNEELVQTPLNKGPFVVTVNPDSRVRSNVTTLSEYTEADQVMRDRSFMSNAAELVFTNFDMQTVEDVGDLDCIESRRSMDDDNRDTSARFDGATSKEERTPEEPAPPAEQVQFDEISELTYSFTSKPHTVEIGDKSLYMDVVPETPPAVSETPVLSSMKRASTFKKKVSFSPRVTTRDFNTKSPTPVALEGWQNNQYVTCLSGYSSTNVEVEIFQLARDDDNEDQLQSLPLSKSATHAFKQQPSLDSTPSNDNDRRNKIALAKIRSIEPRTPLPTKKKNTPKATATTSGSDNEGTSTTKPPKLFPTTLPGWDNSYYVACVAHHDWDKIEVEIFQLKESSEQQKAVSLNKTRSIAVQPSRNNGLATPSTELRRKTSAHPDATLTGNVQKKRVPFVQTTSNIGRSAESLDLVKSSTYHPKEPKKKIRSSKNRRVPLEKTTSTPLSFKDNERHSSSPYDLGRTRTHGGTIDQSDGPISLSPSFEVYASGARNKRITGASGVFCDMFCCLL